MVNSKTWYYVLGALAAVGIGMYAYPTIDAYRWKKRQRQEFGTVANPIYSVVNLSLDERLAESNVLGEILTPEVLAARQRIDQRQTDYDHFEAETKALETLLNDNLSREQLTSAQAKAQKLETNIDVKSLNLGIEKLTSGYPEIERELSKLRLRLLTQETNITSNVKEEDIAREVFRSVTGKDIPSKVRISKEKLEKGIAGFHNPYFKEVSYQDIQYIRNLNTLLHELGHVCAQHQEEGMFSEDKRFERKIIEEACAYAFVDVGAHALVKRSPGLAHLLKINLDYHMNNFQEELHKDSSNEREEHSRGAELYIATRYVLKDPKSVFNYLATLKDSSLDNLDPRIKQRMQETREAMQVYLSENSEFEETGKRYELLKARVEEVRKEIAKRKSSLKEDEGIKFDEKELEEALRNL